MEPVQPATGNGVVSDELSVPDSTSAEQLAADEAVENNGEEAEAPAAAETKEPDVKEKELAELRSKWPGWPGYTVFRIVVPVLKVGGIIGRKGDLIKKLVEETRAKIRVLDGPITSPDRIVLVTGKEEPEAALSPAMDAIIRIFKRVIGLAENDGDSQTTAAAGAAFCTIRLLVASTQAISLIGKQGSLIKSIQENSGASVRVLPNSNDETPIYVNTDERIVELQGEGFKVLKALEAVVGHLRKFLVDHSILPLFEKSYSAPATQERQPDPWSDKTKLLQHATPQTSLSADYPVPAQRDHLYLDRESQLESHNIPPSRLSMYVPDHGLVNHSSTVGRPGGPVVTQVAQTMQIPLAYAEDIIGVQGTNIDYIRRTSGAILTVQESRGLPEEITVEIKGTTTQVHAAQKLIQDFIGGHREPLPGSYSKLESSLRSSYSQLGNSSTFTGQPYGGYGSSGAGGYNSYNRL
ncbi:poly(rc)-binding protein 3 [Phtheirospermum japonicum]|uniref:Poly(Rc)-binding protein 3 n=1 Tax=Phtheirospermum japonicum TaxID=374723 RepID=A0A830BK24_9LAMI|nr:poly(rc)-binding protein 3 [Phtheirospermum japonicum]